ncbi:carbon starvation protein A [Botrimarina mediterranea]|uniref:Carbon starvation protein A n=1 Tax=Botrimarina mediterranea TaxID=2528022 RepID=A0A518KAI5_9BACT|nr:carbon starvation CstA family protein [Botrimarina mediterranea]QDV74804.1 Carbon starvation protein A [Botrimarina mediterranea]QDV79448.1 Carbon starvation protein A [Planctomycetes bacterium K2D]
MNLLWIVLPSAAVLGIAYVTYGRLLARLLRLDAKAPVPAIEQRDGLDFEPISTAELLPQHFSAIAAAGPIVGPILAGLLFGWLPALLWILIGSIFIGGVQDITSLVASIRHRANSIAEVVRLYMSRRSYLMFLIFIWIALVYIIVAFTGVTAAAFVGEPLAENGGVGGGAIASASLIYLAITLAMGIAMRYTGMPSWLGLCIFLPMVVGAIVFGPSVPFDLATITGSSEGVAVKLWSILLLAYCLVAGVLPVWLLLQPRGQLGGYFLYAALGAGAIGLAFGGVKVEYPAFRGWEVATAAGGVATIFPLLFITIACGACSGFHSLIASGTTSKQLRNERDAKPVAYGSMLLEAMVAVVSLCCVMMFAEGAAELSGKPNQIYAHGIGKFLDVIHVSKAIGVTFALMAFTTFVYDTLDVCTRLGRFIVQELTGWHGRGGRLLGSGLTAGVPLFFMLRHPSDAPTPVWQLFWNLFGASNQLLAALTLLGVTVWLWRTRRARWVWFVTGIPTVVMYVMSTWALVSMTAPAFRTSEGAWQAPSDPVPWIGLVLLGLAALMLVEAVRVLTGSDTPPPQPKLTPATM